MSLKNNMSNLIYFDGQFIAEEDAKVSVKSHALHYGTGVFEGIRAYYNEKENCLYAFRMKDHYERFLRSCKILFIDPKKTSEELCEITLKLLQKNFAQTDIYIRPLAFKSDPAVGNFNLKTLKDSLVIYCIPMGRHIEAPNGIKAGVSSWRRIPDNSIPPRGKLTGAYVNTSLAKTESTMNGYDEALLLDSDGHIVEGSAENLFIVKKNQLITPSLSSDILEGITRDTVMTIACDLGIEVIERSIDRSEIYQVEEVFLVGTGAEVIPVVEIDGRKIADGKTGSVSKQIKQIYYDLVHGLSDKYPQYLTKVFPSK